MSIKREVAPLWRHCTACIDEKANIVLRFGDSDTVSIALCPRCTATTVGAIFGNPDSKTARAVFGKATP